MSSFQYQQQMFKYMEKWHCSTFYMLNVFETGKSQKKEYWFVSSLSHKITVDFEDLKRNSLVLQRTIDQFRKTIFMH